MEVVGGLEEYMQAKLPEHEAIIAELDQSIKDALELLSRIDFDNNPDNGKTCLWPYWVVDDYRRKFRAVNSPPSRPSKRISQSTTSMIVAAVAAATNRPWQRYSSGYRWEKYLPGEPAVLDDDLKGKLAVAVKYLIERWEAKKEEPKSDVEEGPPDNAGAPVSFPYCSLSTTFGRNDILTLSWHLDIFNPSSPLAAPTSQRDSIFGQVRDIITRRAITYAKAKSGYTGVLRVFNERERKPKRMVTDSAHNLLRFTRCLQAIDLATQRENKRLPLHIARARDRAFFRFLSKLHDQLSYHSITDSRFDPAELAFCLEGMLHLRPETVNLPLVERVMKVMSESQKVMPYWRTEAPMTANQKGQVLYPASVEVARSLLSSISIFDSRASHHVHRSVGSQYMELITRYWAWLKTRSTNLSVEGKKVTGWHSEHINDTALIHTWETSQILEFLLVFRDQLFRHISRNLLDRSRLSVGWPEVTTTDAATEIGKLPSLRERWSAKVAKFEPLLEWNPSSCQVYGEIGEQFIARHEAYSPNRPWSLLLYGPPGTGKTELAANMASVLEAPLITITVSDFLAEGEARMENRAKQIFDVLRRQTFSVVLFDEMDHFMLDRDSERFRQQDSAFQFLTPGMLTKLAELRKEKSVIFIVATNYEERIDPAIKRPGRIDHLYLMLPPNAKRRLDILETFDNTKAVIKKASIELREEIAAASVFLGFKDMERLADGHGDGKVLSELLWKAPRSISFFSYKERFAKMPDGGKINLSQGPKDELAAIFQLANEVWSKRHYSGEMRQAFRTAMKELVSYATEDSVAEFKRELRSKNVAMDELIYLEPSR